MCAQQLKKRWPANKHIALWAAGCVLVGVLFAYAPVSYEYVVRNGTDAYETHHALWGKREKTIVQTATSPVRGVGLVLVYLREPDRASRVQVAVESGGNRKTLVRELPVGADDAFLWFDFSTIVAQAGEEYTVFVSAPESPQASPVGVRFSRADGKLALAVREQIPVWEYVLRWVEEHEERSSLALRMVGMGSIAAAILLMCEAAERKKRGAGIMIGCLLLVFLTLSLRTPLAYGVDSAFGGDAFNYFLKSRAWISGEDPFAADFRKAPLYSFLIMPGLLPGLDPVLWARGVSILAALGTVLMVPALLLNARVPLPFALAAGALLSVNREYQFESVQGLSNTVYAACIVAAAYVFTIGRTYLVSVCAALAALVRYEGAAVAGVLIPASWVVYRMKTRRIIRDIVPFAVLCAIPFLLTPLTGEAGVRTFSDIQSDEGLYLGFTWETFEPSFTAFRLFFGRLWVLTPLVGSPFAWLLSGACAGCIGTWLWKKSTAFQYVWKALPVLLVAALLLGVLFGEEYEKLFIGFVSFFAGVGMGVSLWLRPRISIPIILMLVIQAVVITAILPKNRYYLQLIPFLAAAIVLGMWAMSVSKRGKRIAKICSLVAICMIGVFVQANAAEHLSGQLSDYNEKSAGQTVLLSSARMLRHESGIVAAAEGSDLQFRVYVPYERLITMPDSLRDVDMQLAMLEGAGVEYVVNTTENPYFTKLIEAKPERFEVLASYTTKWSDVTVTVYRIY